MTASANKADILALLSFINEEFGFDTSAARNFLYTYCTITPTGLSVVKKIPVLGNAQLLITVGVGPGGSLMLRIAQARVLGAGFLVGLVRVIAAKMVVNFLSGYHQFFATGLDKNRNILLHRPDIAMQNASTGADLVGFTAEVVTPSPIPDVWD